MTTARVSRGIALITVAGLLMVLASWSDAQAIISIPGPGCPNINVTDNARLDGDIYTTTTGTCIYMQNSGDDIDLNGHVIYCDNDPNDPPCGTAIYANKSGTKVSGGGGINGDWQIGVLGAEEVTGISILVGDTNIKDEGERAKKIHNNYLSCNVLCIDVVMPRNTDFIRDNLINYPFLGSIRIEGNPGSGLGPTVEGNTVTTTFGTAIEQVGGSNKVRMFDNTISDCSPPSSFCDPVPFEVDNSSLALDLSVWVGNVCSDQYYCPPAPTCSNGGSVVCVDDEPVCSPVP
jgi:hypothetical protein